MTGFEWALATHLAWRGLVREAEKVAAAVRARYDGAKRNPWNEIECGSNYARAMADPFGAPPCLAGRGRRGPTVK